MKSDSVEGFFSTFLIACLFFFGLRPNLLASAAEVS